ncbi:CRISPR-associated endonuclease Cas2 [Candidatus Roizmanbacteria bacterium CG22_combo_CG10-13_8_21_14_all_38_20]|uniref:CRISPR-associated endoribonuclease Cas2 n=1 Tax=Candidatus Roizmanbacteria bacterium CG22_combo_CG10-13_8_21_14_all_38_20 TaxID=1974862 RepID=A0A2H0BWT1_9BACT|nr:MAG: CRISPR-associated endonuclease Cas2 [Candidatus Roizmanbacteria bacterium CG22_combo_CG10-13_8_21_14_all_38_20]PJC31806.1 MAG: CRISPR-associated endonuclease Cas2 [Candidatus Roizmanbacteria bacterium CG_4_9_14_0_2_um_filter_38_17]
MIIVSYDFSDDKRRAKFSRFLEQYGDRIQYSVFKIRNSRRVINNILTEIEHSYKKNFEKTDSIYVLQVCNGCMKGLKRYGSAVHEEESIVYFG